MHLSTRLVFVACAALAAAASCAGPALATGGPAAPGGAARTGSLTWSVVHSPNKPTRMNELAGVSCVSATACAAVGWYGNKTLAESWNGTTWSVAPAPRHAGNLNGVSCVSASACVAVGESAGKTLAESWNGTTWSVVPTPNPSADDQLSAVSCVSASACTAVGYGPGTTSQPLVESWNGTAWSVVPSPSPGPGQSRLSAVSCVSASACTAVGESGYKTLAESWNGTAWSVVPTLNPGSDSNELLGVSCVSASACTAVGYDAHAGGALVRALEESWNGTAWSLVPTPHLAARGGGFNQVSCVSASACTAVGYRTTSEFGDRTLAESWDGSKWSVVRTPNKASGYQGNYLTGVSCVPAGSCTAAGYYTTLPDGYDGAKTLVETNSAKP
jgi:hypothetical protein